MIEDFQGILLFNYCLNLTIPDATECNRMQQKQQNATECNRMQQNATECNRMQQNATECNRMQQNATECNRMQQNATECNSFKKVMDVVALCISVLAVLSV